MAARVNENTQVTCHGCSGAQGIGQSEQTIADAATMVGATGRESE